MELSGSQAFRTGAILKHAFPSYTRLERIADGCVHAVSVIFSLAAAALLLIGAIGLPAAIFIGLIVYSFGLIGMFGHQQLTIWFRMWA